MTIELCVYVDVLHIFQFTGSVHFDGASPNINFKLVITASITKSCIMNCFISNKTDL